MNNCFGKEIMLLKIFLGVNEVKSFIKYLEIANAEKFWKPFLNSEASTCNSMGKFGSLTGFI